MSDDTRIRTEPCPHCYHGRMPMDGHTVAELKDETLRRGSTPRPEMAERIKRIEAEQAAARRG